MGGLNPGKRRPVKATAKAAAETSGQVIHLLSDSTGNLARHMLSACLTQFQADAVAVRLHPFLSSKPKLEHALDQVAEQPGAVVHALLKKDAKVMVQRRCERLNLPCTDLTGGFVSFLSNAVGLKSKPDLKRLHKVDATYQRRISALDFTIAHDDAAGLQTLHKADVVLTGVSRTSKTPTSVILAQEGLKVANVSLAMQVPPPDELLAMDNNRVVALLIDPSVLCEIRTRRWQTFGGTSVDSRYADPDYVADEVDWCRRLFRQQGWSTLDVTDQAIEETAAKVLQLIRQKNT